MPIEFRAHAPEWIPAIQEFNQRLGAGGAEAEMRLPESLDQLLPDSELVLATEGQTVRGGYILRRQKFLLSGEPLSVAHYRLPLSEGIIEKKYTALGVQMLRSALRTEPHLYALGMGAFDRPLPRMLQAMGWSLYGVPFYFQVVRPARFFRNIGPLRRTALRRFPLHVAAYSGAAWLGLRALAIARRVKPPAQPVEAIEVSEFSGWADEVWERSKGAYALAGERSSAVLNRLYPPGGRFLRWKMVRGSEPVGWVLALDTQMRGHKQFGNLRVGTIADGMAAPQDAVAMVYAAQSELKRRGVDLTISNQAHAAWGLALRDAGFLTGPTNFIFAASPKLAAALEPWEQRKTGMHLNRGDGDGPIHL